MSLTEFLSSSGAVALRRPAADWREALRLGVDLLVGAGVASPSYYDAIVASTLEHGPYYVIAPGLAMPHARAPGTVWAEGYSLLTLERPVPFGNAANDPVDIVLCVCARDDGKLNEEVIVEVAELFDGEEGPRAVRAAREIGELFDALGWGRPR